MNDEQFANLTYSKPAFLLNFSKGGEPIQINKLRPVETWRIRHQKAQVGDEVYFLKREKLKTLENNLSYIIGRGRIIKGPYPESEYGGEGLPLGWASYQSDRNVVDVQIEDLIDIKIETPLTLAQLSLTHPQARLWHRQPNGMPIPEQVAEVIRRSRQWKATAISKPEVESEELSVTSYKAWVETRIGQQKFRENLLQYWRECSVTGCSFHEVLIASHIVPWSEASDSERLDVFNGLLLTPNLDKLFDNYLISFNSDGNILISKSLSSKAKSDLGINPSMKLRRTDEKLLSYLQKHEAEFLAKEQARCLHE